MCFCVFVFFNKKHKNTRKKFLVVFFSAVELNQRANVFLCFCVFFVKNTKTQWPNFFCLFFSNRTAPESLCVFVFLCFFTKNTKTHWPIFFCLSFSAIELQQRTNVFFVFMCFFYTESTKTQRPKIGLYF